MFALRMGARILGLVQAIVLARLLVPEDFGIAGMAILVVTTLESVTQTGIESALIVRKNADRPAFDTAWTITVARSVGIFGLVALGSPLAAWFFETPGLEPYVMVVAGGFLLTGFANIGVVLFRKRLQFRRLFAYELSAVVPNLLVSVTLAYAWRSPWAIVLGLVAGNATRLVASYVLHPYRPRFRLDRSAAREIYEYGRWLFGTGILTFLANKGDDLFVGRVLGAGPLGLYQMAFRLGEKPREDITSVISQVALPAYALTSGDADRLHRGYRMSLEAAAGLTFPLIALVVALASDITRVLLGPDWLPMVPAFRILAVAGGVRAVLALGGNLSQGVGRPDMDFRMNMTRLVVMAGAIYPLTVHWALAGAAGSVLLGLLAAVPVWVHISARFAGITSRDYLSVLAPPLIGSGIIFAAVIGVKLRFGGLGLGGLAGAVLLATLVYSLWGYALWRAGHTGPFRAIRTVYRGLVSSSNE